MTTSRAWADFEKSDYAKRTIASLDKKAADASHPDPKSAPGSLENVGWQSGNGNVPINPDGAKGASSSTPIKVHDLKETAKPIHDLAKKAPTGKVASVLVKMVKIAEAWENSGDAKLAPYAAELNDIIQSTMAEYATPTVAAKLGLKKQVEASK